MRRPQLLLSLISFLGFSASAQQSPGTVRLPIDAVNKIAQRLSEPLNIEGLQQGNVPVVVRWTEVRVDTSANRLWMAGTVVEPAEGIPLAGVRLVAGGLMTDGSTMRIVPRAGVVADDEGRFAIDCVVERRDVLVITMLGHLEATLPVGLLLELPARLAAGER